MTRIVLRRRKFSLFARYSLKFTRCSLLVAQIARYSLQKLLVAKNHLLLVANFARYSLQKLLAAKNHSLLVAEVARCKKSLVTRCKNSLVTRFKIRSLLVAKIHSLLVAKFARYSFHNLLVTRGSQSLVTQCKK